MKSKFLILLFSVAFIASCSPQKRINRILKKNPELTTDTTILDTVEVPAIQIDTVFQLLPGDTIKIKDTSGVNIELGRVGNNDFWLSVERPAETIVKPLVLPRILTDATKGKKCKRWHWVEYFLGIITTLIIYILLFKRPRFNIR